MSVRLPAPYTEPRSWCCCHSGFLTGTRPGDSQNVTDVEHNEVDVTHSEKRAPDDRIH